MKLKRTLIALLCLIFVFSFGSCKNQQDDENKNEGSKPKPEEDIILNDNKPVLSGTFIQPYLCVDWNEQDYKNHFEELKSVGIDTFIIQWTATTPEGKVKDIYYKTGMHDSLLEEGVSVYDDVVETCLKVAQQTGMKVFVGLNLSDEWWNDAILNNGWAEKQGKLSNIMAKEMHQLYKEKYPDAFYGWYWAWEMYNGMNGNEEKYAKMINLDLDFLTKLDPSMPLLLSPFNRTESTAEKAGKEWEEFFKYANFREGDIFCCQDAVGAEWISIERLDAYYKNIKKAVETKKGLNFWANNENFLKYGEDNFKSGYLDRFYKQMDISSKYVEKHITFSYSHYYSTTSSDFNPGFHESYKKYVNESKVDKTPPAKADLKFDYTKGEKSGTIKITIDQTDTARMSAYQDGKVMKTIDVSKGIYSKGLKGEVFEFKIPATLDTSKEKVKFSVDTYDFWNNKNTAVFEFDLK